MEAKIIRLPDGTEKMISLERHVGEKVAMIRATEGNVSDVTAYLKMNPNASLEDLKKLFPAAP